MGENKYVEKWGNSKYPDTDKKIYEKIIEYTIYEDSDIVKAIVCKDMISGGFISEEDLTTYYMGSEDFFTQISNAAKP